MQMLRPCAVALAGCFAAGGALAQSTSPSTTPSGWNNLAAAVACTPGTWRVGNPSGAAPVRFETTHFAFRWNGSTTTTQAAQTAGNYLESIWGHFVNNTLFPEPYCSTANKFKANIHIDPTFGLSGGVDGQGFMGMWIGPGANARVLGGVVRGNARVEDFATVIGGEVSGNGIVSGLSLISANTIVRDNARVSAVFMPLGSFERNIVLSGTAQNIGDVEQRGASMSRGVLYGFIDLPATTNPRRGSNLAAPVREITAPPVFRWR